jgi:autotransporter strand-loop-strand O-heptosyltransferase
MQINYHFKTGPRVEIRDNVNRDYRVEFINNQTNEVIFEDTVKSNFYSRAYAEYYVPWKIKVHQNGSTIDQHVLDLRGQKVLVTFESSAMGDSVCWIPYVAKFQQKHQCQLDVSTFYNDILSPTYQNLNFIDRKLVKNTAKYKAVYKIGWFGTGGKSTKNPSDCRTVPLQQVASDILGLDYYEIRPNVKRDNRAPMINTEKYVTISTCSTAQAKYWNNPTGWQEVVNYLNSLGYVVVVVGREKTKLQNVLDRTGIYPRISLINMLQYSDFFIGISSGLTWLNWGLGNKSIMISGFTHPDFEFQTDNYRVFNPDVCNSCFTNPNYHFERADWTWCPVNKNKKDQFICTKAITSKMVIEQIDKIIADSKNAE